MLSKVFAAQVIGLHATIITVEVDISKSLKAFTVVGLPDKAVEESKDRISAAIKNAGFPSPHKGNKKTVVALSPADIKKEGPIFDVGIAVGHLLASGEISFDASKKLFIGELALNGDILPVRGTLLLARLAQTHGFEELYVPAINAQEAALVNQNELGFKHGQTIKIFPCSSLMQIVRHLRSARLKNSLTHSERILPQETTVIEYEENQAALDLALIRGQESAKRALEIAAAGGHNAAMFGPPGTGKTMLAQAFLGILPPLTMDEVLEVTGIHSMANEFAGTLITQPPFRAPHHSASPVSVLGGGANPRPGEITLAHRGVLFLDEFPEFDRRVIESLRQPLEDGIVRISRAKGSATFPAQFILITAMNPCPCGNRGTNEKRCECSASSIQKYERKISGPIVDRIDIWIEVPHVDYEKLSATGRTGNDSALVRARVSRARERMRQRFAEHGINKGRVSEMDTRDIERFAVLTPALAKQFNNSARALNLSARSYHRVIKIARTIADLGASEAIEEPHLLEALTYRPKLNT